MGSSAASSLNDSENRPIGGAEDTFVKISLAFGIALGLSLGTAFGAEKPIDYQKLDLTVTLTSLRAGNHDASGVNQYYFQTKLYGLPVLKEEIKKPFAERKKSEADLGNFAEIKIESLKFWTPEKKPTSIVITGDRMRALIAETMRTGNVPEEETALLVNVSMYAKAKKFGWLGEDLKIGEVTFPVIPETLPHKPNIKNETLAISDKQGTFVELKVEYKALEAKKDDKSAAAAVAGPDTTGKKTETTLAH